MKWIVLGGLLALIPVLTILLRSKPNFIVHACYFMGLMVFFFNPCLNVDQFLGTGQAPSKVSR